MRRFGGRGRSAGVLKDAGGIVENEKGKDKRSWKSKGGVNTPGARERSLSTSTSMSMSMPGVDGVSLRTISEGKIESISRLSRVFAHSGKTTALSASREHSHLEGTRLPNILSNTQHRGSYLYADALSEYASTLPHVQRDVASGARVAKETTTKASASKIQTPAGGYLYMDPPPLFRRKKKKIPVVGAKAKAAEVKLMDVGRLVDDEVDGEVGSEMEEVECSVGGDAVTGGGGGRRGSLVEYARVCGYGEGVGGVRSGGAGGEDGDKGKRRVEEMGGGERERVGAREVEIIVQTPLDDGTETRLDGEESRDVVDEQHEEHADENLEEITPTWLDDTPKLIPKSRLDKPLPPTPTPSPTPDPTTTPESSLDSKTGQRKPRARKQKQHKADFWHAASCTM